MPWSVTYNPDALMIEHVYAGEIDLNSLVEGTMQSVALAKQHNCVHHLVDETNIDPHMTVFDIYGMVELYETLDVDQHSRVAIVFSKESPFLKNAMFYENTCQNRGYNVRILHDFDEAKKWLNT